MIQTRDLTKRYGKHTAVEGLNLNVRQGEIYGFLGPNGAGKTTTIHMLLNLVHPTHGSITVFDGPIGRGSFTYKRDIGVVAEEPVEASKVRGWELVRFFAGLYGVSHPEKRMEELFRSLELWDARDSMARDYSRGMRQKLSLIRALVHNPRLLILDEPVSGLDPHGIQQVRELIDEYQSRGGTVFISSHILSEVERSADRIGILHKGRLLVEDTLAGLRHRLARGHRLVVELESISPVLVSRLQEEPYILELQAEGRRLELLISDDADARRNLFYHVTESGGVILRMENAEMSLEEAFVTITNRNVEQLAGAQ